MLGLDHDDHPAGIQLLHQGFGDLAGEPLLNLGPLGVQVHQPGDLRQAGDPAVLAGDVADVGHPVERHQVMLAGGIERDLLDDHHLVVILVEHGVQDALGLGVEPGEHLAVGARDAGRRVLQALSIRVFADRVEQLADRGLGALLVEGPDARRRVAGIRPQIRPQIR